jgi:hypothetical protein
LPRDLPRGSLTDRVINIPPASSERVLKEESP